MLQIGEGSRRALGEVLGLTNKAISLYSIAGRAGLDTDTLLSQGGLRDLHCLQWIDLADPTLLEDSERQALDGPHDVLLSARIELHRATGRANNQLLLQEQTSSVYAYYGLPLISVRDALIPPLRAGQVRLPSRAQTHRLARVPL